MKQIKKTKAAYSKQRPDIKTEAKKPSKALPDLSKSKIQKINIEEDVK